MKNGGEERLESLLRNVNKVQKGEKELFSISIGNNFVYIFTDIEKEKFKIPKELEKHDGKIKTNNIIYEIVFIKKF